MLRKYLSGKLALNAWLGIVLILLFGTVRFAAVLYGIQSGDNKYLSVIFFLMILTPYAMLTKEGRKFIKIQKPKGVLPVVYSLLLGSLICLAIFGLGQVLYGSGISNWFRYIGESYPVDLKTISHEDKKIYFIVFLIIGMTFSPFGEELLYRGLVHGSFATGLGERKAALIDSAAFGLTHLAHFGVIYYNGTWSFYLWPAVIWVLLMFASGLVFNYCKAISDSIVGAIVGHMGFNIAMTYVIFYHIF